MSDVAVKRKELLAKHSELREKMKPFKNQLDQVEKELNQLKYDCSHPKELLTYDTSYQDDVRIDHWTTSKAMFYIYNCECGYNLHTDIEPEKMFNESEDDE